MSIEMRTDKLPKCFSLLPIPHNRILRNTQLIAIKLHLLFNGKVPSFLRAGAMGQRRHGRNLSTPVWAPGYRGEAQRWRSRPQSQGRARSRGRGRGAVGAP
jgi:hypothetical protein